MSNQIPQVESYVPTAAFYDGKREASGVAFRDRFAVVDANSEFSILAFRGENLKIGETIPVLQEQVALLRFYLARGERVMVEVRAGTALFFGDWMLNGLVPVLLLREPCDDLSVAANLILRREIITIGEQKKGEMSKRELNQLCCRFSDSLAECDRVFNVEETEHFRRHAARIAAFAGCRADFSDLPFESLALSMNDTRKWTLLLLCLFLSLRGISGEEPSVLLRDVRWKTILSGINFSTSQDAKKQTSERLSFLQHPAFEGVEAESTPEGLRFSVVLSRRRGENEFCAFSESIQLCFVFKTE